MPACSPLIGSSLPPWAFVNEGGLFVQAGQAKTPLLTQLSYAPLRFTSTLGVQDPLHDAAGHADSLITKFRHLRPSE